MKNLFKPASLLCNLLTFLTFFFVGLFFAKIMEVGKGQMLAAGAIVLGYGIIFASVALIGSFVITYKLKHKIIVRINILLLTILISFFAYFTYQYQVREKSEQEEKQLIQKSTQRNKILNAEKTH